jgi:NADP-dependent 3-hydroxy acid dehydrogenase YdfG
MAQQSRGELIKNGQTVLVTGASTGIGRATAIALSKKGYRVFASARDISSLSALSNEFGINPLALDVDSQASINRAMQSIEQMTSGYGIDILINNAGFAVPGPIETVPIERLRAGFETNVVGLVRMCQAVLPQMRVRGSGCIVNLSSIVGSITFPFEGAYTATKHAVESISDALRFEVHPYGIRVLVVQPGAINTAFQARGNQEFADSNQTRSPYQHAMSGFMAQRDKAFLEAPNGTAVAQAIVRELGRQNGATRIVVPGKARLLLAVFGGMPDKISDAIKRRVFAPQTSKVLHETK